MIYSSSLTSIIIFLILCLFMLSLFYKAHIPSSVGYIAIGILAGPSFLNIFPDLEGTRLLAEMGIVLLMFMVGLEFSLSKLLEAKHAVFVTGGLQTFIILSVIAVMAYFYKFNFIQSILLGGVVAASSTAIVTKQLADQGELYTHLARTVIGILLFQDVALLPFLIISSNAGGPNNQQLVVTLFQVLPLNLLAIVGFFLAGRWLFRPFIYYMASFRSGELFMATAFTVLMIVFWIAERLSIALPIGAFVVGMVLGETTLKHQLEEDLRPFHAILVGIFFISIGKQFDPGVFLHQWPLIFLLAASLIIIKIILGSLTSLITKHSLTNAIQSALILAHSGEFGLLILTAAMERHLFEQSIAQPLLAAILITICISPFLIYYHKKIVAYLSRFFTLELTESVKDHLAITGKKGHIVVCGYGKIGAYLSAWLKREKIPFIVVDYHTERVQQAKSLGYEVIYGDATRKRILEKVGLEQAKAVAITFNEAGEVYKIAHLIKINWPQVITITRALDENAIKNLQAAGVEIILPEAIEISHMFGKKLFFALGYSPEKIEQLISQLYQQELKGT